MPIPDRAAAEADWRTFFNRIPAVLDGSRDSLFQAMRLYIHALEREQSDSSVAMLLANKVVETEAFTELGVLIYLHACYICGAHDKIFTYVGSFIDNKRYEGYTEHELRRRCPAQFLMYRYDREFIEGLVSENSLPALHLTQPTIRRHTRLVVITGCDDRYFKRYLADSILRVSMPLECLFHSALIDSTTDTIDRLELISSNAANIVFSHTQHTEYYPSEELGYISSSERKVTTYACHRFFIAEQIILNSNCPIVLLDSDTEFERIDYKLLVKCVNALDADIGIARWEVDHTPGTSFLADMIVIQPSASGRMFLKLLTRYCYFYITRGLSFWTLDQVALNAIHHYLSTANIPYNNIDLNKTNIKRECNIRHITSEQFRQER